MTEPTNDEPKMFPEDYVKELRDENAQRRLAEKNVRDQLAQVRDALGVPQDDGSADVVQTIHDLRSRSEADRGLAAETLVRAEFNRAAAELDEVDADAAWRLADKDGIRVDLESRKVEGLREVLETLVRDKPFLVSRAGSAGSPGGGTPRTSASPGDDSLEGRVRKQFQKRLPSGMTVPGESIGRMCITR